MSAVKERPRRQLEPDFWRARRERRCKGCRRTFMPQARSELYCEACSEAGKGWAGRKAKQAPNPGEKAAEIRQITVPSARELVAYQLRQLHGPHPAFFFRDLMVLSRAPERDWWQALNDAIGSGYVVAFQAGYRLTAAGIMVAGDAILCPGGCPRCDAWRAGEDRKIA